MTANNIENVEILDSGYSEQRLRLLGGAAMSADNKNTASQPEFVPRTYRQLLNQVIEQGAVGGYDVDTLDYQTQPNFTHSVHGVLNGYYMEQHRAEWAENKENSIAPPLPYQWVKSRLDTYYTKVSKGDGDSAHETTIKQLRKNHLPAAIEMTRALPEIEAAVEIQAMLDDAGKEMAADAVSDLLVVYGITIYYLREKQAKLRQERLDMAARSRGSRVT